MIDDPVFVVGAPRSGTTLTARILGAHSAFFMPGETHFIEDIYARRRELGDPRDAAARARILGRLKTLYGRYREYPDQARIEGLDAEGRLAPPLEAARSYRDILSIFMESQMRAVGKVRWGNQAPRDLFALDLLFAFYSRARVIVAVRDPRDFLVSYKDKGHVPGDADAGRLARLYHPLVTALLWKAAMRALARARARYPGRIMVSRYESLVAAPGEAARAICAFTSLSYEAGMIEAPGRNSSAPGAAPREAIFTASVGRWREGLAAEEVVIAEAVAGRDLGRFGYVPARPEAGLLRLVVIFLSTPWALIAGLSANRAKRGPLLPYLARRLRALLARPGAGP